jgi:hypothetical protein
MIIHNLCVIMQKPPKNRLQSRFLPFFCKIGLILHISALMSGNYWLSSDLEQLELLEYAISSISNQPKAKKSTKTWFSKFLAKWLSLEATAREKVKIFKKCPQISILTIYFRELTDSKHFRKNFFLDHSKFFKNRTSLLTKKKVGSRFFPVLKVSPVVANLPNFHFWAFGQNPVTKNLPKN